MFKVINSPPCTTSVVMRKPALKQILGKQRPWLQIWGTRLIQNALLLPYSEICAPPLRNEENLDKLLEGCVLGQVGGQIVRPRHHPDYE